MYFFVSQTIQILKKKHIYKSQTLFPFTKKTSQGFIMKYDTLFIDLDGLLDTMGKSRKINENFINMLKEFQQNGEIYYCTSRSRDDITEYYQNGIDLLSAGRIIHTLPNYETRDLPKLLSKIKPYKGQKSVFIGTHTDLFWCAREMHICIYTPEFFRRGAVKYDHNPSSIEELAPLILQL